MAPGSVYPIEFLGQLMHRAFLLYAHLTWHTSRRERSIDKACAEMVRDAILASAKRNHIHMLGFAILADHVHALVSYRPDYPVTPFVRDAKSESSRRISEQKPGLLFRWARGYYAGSLSWSHIERARIYVGNQFRHHPDLIPS